MAEDAYPPEYKEDQAAVGTVLRRRFRQIAPETARLFRYRQLKPEADYTAFKATVASAVEEIKLEMKVQHEQTRAEVQTVRRDVLAAIKASPAEYLTLICEFGSLFLLFSLTIRFILKIELVNTGFALFMLAAFAVYWAMARLKQESDKRQREDT